MSACLLRCLSILIQKAKDLFDVRLLLPVRKGLDESISELGERWSNLILNPDQSVMVELEQIISNEHVRNVVQNRSKNRVLVREFANIKLGALQSHQRNAILKYHPSVYS